MAKFEKPQFEQIQAPQRFTPDPGDDNSHLIQGVGSAIQAGHSIYKKQQKDNAVDELKGELEQTGKVVATINEAQALSGKGAKTFDERTGDVLLIDGAPEEFTNRYNEVMKESGEEFRAIASGVSQGATPKAAAAIQIEAKLKELSNLYPEFTDELRATARSLTGYDATGYHLKQLLNINDTGSTGSKTFAQKKEEEVQFIASTMGLDPDLVRHGIAKELYTEQQRSIRENMVKSGKITAQSLIVDDIAETGPYMENFWVEQAQIVKNGGVTNPEMQLTMLEKAQAEHRSELLNELRKTSGSFSVDRETTQFLDDQLKAMYDPIKDAIARNDFGKILERQGKTMLELDKQYGRTVWPRLVRMNNALGERLTSTIIDQMSSFANNEQWQLYVKQQPLLNEAINGAQMSPQQVANKAMDVYEKVITNQPLSSDDRDWLPAVEPVIFHPKQDPEIRKSYLEGVGKQDSRGVGWLAQPGKRSIATKKDVDWMKREWKQTVPALVSDVAREMVENPNLKVEVMDNGKLRLISSEKKFARKGVPGESRSVVNRKSIAQLNYFLNATRNGWANDFNTTPQRALQEITKQITQEAEDLEGTEEPSFVEQLGEEAASQLKSVGDFILKSHREYEDIVNGRRKAKSGNELLQELADKINSEIERVRTKGLKKDGTEK